MSAGPDNFWTLSHKPDRIKRLKEVEDVTVEMFLGALSAVMVFVAYIPYMIDIMKGRVRPARSTRMMFTLLLVIALLQQYALGSGWTMAVTVGEALGSILLLGLSLKRGVGGFTRLDLICYGLLALDMGLWLSANNAFLALHLTLVADTIAFVPTLVKTWRWPDSETALFYIAGTIAPLLAILAEADNLSYGVLIFPLYLSLANGLEVGLILFRRTASQGATSGIIKE